jgi:glyoxalase family protein
MKEILGIHHVTAIASDPQRNLDFYTGVLGLRLVKLTVNFDDPGAYHLYYGDEVGHPGTILTFFAWPGAPHGRRGTQQATTTSFSIPESALGYWMERFRVHGVTFEKPIVRPDEETLVFFDPDGLQLELVAHDAAEARDPWREGPVPGERAICGFHSVTLSEQQYERTASLLMETLGFRLAHESGERLRYRINHGGTGAMVDVLRQPNGMPGSVAVGSVHHVAWRTPDDEQQLAWRQEIGRTGLDVTQVMDRQYFRSIYFREPGGVLFEIATDPPGFAVDETVEQLGTQLKLPPWLEPMRADIERGLPPVHVRQTMPER